MYFSFDLLKEKHELVLIVSYFRKIYKKVK